MGHMQILLLLTGLLVGLAAGGAVVFLAVRGRHEAATAALTADLARLQQAADYERARADERGHYAEQVEQKIAGAVEAAAARAVKGNNDEFLALAGQRLAPIDDRLQAFEQQLHEFRTSHGSISQQLSSVARETSNLTSALRKPSVRGRWGEISLRNVVEAAGLSAYCDFNEQVTVNTDDGSRRPDLVVNLPGRRHVVVDAKVPLEAYLDAIDIEDEDARAAKLKEHAGQVRKHISELSKKAYWDQFERAPECIVMFLRLEPTLAAALEHDTALFEDAARARVILATPTTLVGVLFAIGQAWRQEAVAENAEHISALGRELYTRLAKMHEHFAKLGQGIKSVVTRYNDTVGSLESRVMVTARKFDALGAAVGEIKVADQVEVAPRPVAAEELPDGRVFELPAGVEFDDDDYGTLGRAAP